MEKDAELLSISPHISLNMKSEARGVVLFRIRSVMPLGKLKDAYCSQMGLDKDAVSLRFDGEIIQENDTAISLEMENEDIVDVLMTPPTGAGDAVALVPNTPHN